MLLGKQKCRQLFRQDFCFSTSVWAPLDHLSSQWPRILALSCWGNWTLRNLGSGDTPRVPCSAGPGLLLVSWQRCGLGAPWLAPWERCTSAYGSMSTCELAAAPTELACTASLPCSVRWEKYPSEVRNDSYGFGPTHTSGWRGRVVFFSENFLINAAFELKRNP